MFRMKQCAGAALAAFGAGMLVAVFFKSGICPVLVGLGCLVGGLFCYNS